MKNQPDSAEHDRSTLIRSGIGNITLKIASLCLAFAVSVGLARKLGPDGFGVYSLVLSLLSLLAIPAQFGLPTLIIRETAAAKAAENWALVKGLWSRSDAFVIGFAVILVVLTSILFLLYSKQISVEYFGPFWLGILLVPLIALGNLRGAGLTGLGHVVLGRLPERILRPGIFFVLILLIPSATWSNGLTPGRAMGLHVAAALVAFIIGNHLLVRNCPKIVVATTKKKFDTRSWITAALPLGLYGGMHSLTNYADILILGVFRPAEDVGIYRVALSVSALTNFGLSAVSMVVAPRFANLQAVGNKAGLQRMVTISTRVILALSLPVAIVIFLVGQNLLSVFYGEGYQLAYVPLVVLALGQLINAGVGTVGYLLNMTGHQVDALIGMTISTVANLLLNLFLIPRFGMLGAAIATCASMIIWNISLYLFVRRRLGINSLAWRKLS